MVRPVDRSSDRPLFRILTLVSPLIGFADNGSVRSFQAGRAPPCRGPVRPSARTAGVGHQRAARPRRVRMGGVTRFIVCTHLLAVCARFVSLQSTRSALRARSEGVSDGQVRDGRHHRHVQPVCVAVGSPFSRLHSSVLLLCAWVSMTEQCYQKCIVKHADADVTVVSAPPHMHARCMRCATRPVMIE